MPWEQPKKWQKDKKKKSRRKEIIRSEQKSMKQKQGKLQKRSMKLKAASLKRSTKLVNLQPDLSSKKRERTQIHKVRNEKGEVTTDITEIQRIIRDYYMKLYVNKMEHLEEMDKFLEKYNLPRPNQDEIKR